MARRYRRRHRYTVARPLKTTKYSSETYSSLMSLSTSTQNTHASFTLYLIPNAIGGVLGTRKAKNFTLRLCAKESSITSGGTTTFTRATISFALVYVPEGTIPSAVQFGSGLSAASLYEPNQNVILSGLIDSTQVYSFKTRLARNLNSGDQIALLLYDLNVNDGENMTVSTPVAATCNYAISF